MPLVKYNKQGEEIPDTTKPEIPLGFKKPDSLAEQVRRLIRSEQLRQAALSAGHETFEEADDFEVGDDYDPRSPYEEVFDPTDPEEVVEQVKERIVKRKSRSAKGERTAPEAQPKKKGKGEKPPSPPQGSGDEDPQAE